MNCIIIVKRRQGRIKKILVVNGSPKIEKSDTMCMTNAFLEGMKGAGDFDIEILHVYKKHIEFCSGGLCCMKNGGNCIHKDDMKEILGKILGADFIIFSFPLYCYGFPAALKNLIDRTLPLSSIKMQRVDGRYEHLTNDGVDYKDTRFVMISGSGFPGTENNFEPAVCNFKRIFPREGNEILTVPESPLFNIPEASPVAVPKLAQIKKAGQEYAGSGKISSGTHAEISIPMIPPVQYMNINNGL